MRFQDDKLAPPDDLSNIVKQVRDRTPARLLTGRSGAAYRTNTQLDLREAHAAARDAVRAELNLTSDLGDVFVSKWNLFEVSSQARNKDEYLLRPDLGRHLNKQSHSELTACCATGRDLQIIIGDGLSVTAVAKQVPQLLPLLYRTAKTRGWSLGEVFVIRHCRVGILNEIGELLSPKVAVLLIGERPGLATAESLSAYMAYQPGKTHTDANRNLISNIHSRGLNPQAAAVRVLKLAGQMMAQRISGFNVREQLPEDPRRQIG